MSKRIEWHKTVVCPECHSTTSVAFVMQGESVAPAAGDVLLCEFCGAPGVFGEDMELARPTPEETQAIQEELRKR